MNILATAFVFLLFGGLNSLSKKWQVLTCTPGMDGKSDIDCKNGTGENFEKPWLQILMMFSGEILCLLYFYATRKKKNAILADRAEAKTSNINESNASSKTELPDSTFYKLLFFPTLFDVCDTGLGGIGLLYLSASLWSMMKSSVIIWTALCNCLILKRKMDTHHWTGVFLTLSGLILIGMSSVWAEMAQDGIQERIQQGMTQDLKQKTSSLMTKENELATSKTKNFLRELPVSSTFLEKIRSRKTSDRIMDQFNDEQASVRNTSNVLNSMSSSGMKDSSSIITSRNDSSIITSRNDSSSESQLMIGMIIVVISRFFAALQFISEEVMCSGGSALQVVGGEGIWGLALMAFILPILHYVPGPDNGSLENVLDGFYKIKENSHLLGFVLLYIFSATFFNVFGMIVTQKLTAVVRVLIDALRTLIIWSIELLLFYCFSSDQYGDHWQGNYSLLKILGFGICIIGTLVYKGVLGMRGFKSQTLLERSQSTEDRSISELREILFGVANVISPKM